MRSLYHRRPARLDLALPDFPCYRRLAEKAAWFQPMAPFVYYWVQANGQVLEE